VIWQFWLVILETPLRQVGFHTIRISLRLDVMCGKKLKKDRKKTFFPFLFFTVFVKCFERHLDVMSGKKVGKIARGPRGTGVMRVSGSSFTN